MATCSKHPGEPLPGCVPCRTGTPFQQPAPAEPEPAAGPVELDAMTAAWRQAALSATAEIARFTEIRDRAIEHIQAAMGDATAATLGGRPAVSWAWSKPGQTLDRKALEADLGKDVVAAKYLKTSKPARPFKILAGDA